MNYYVYIITNLMNGKKYIGKRSCRCPIEEDRYMGSGVILSRAKRKYGIEWFEKKILMVCDSEEEVYKEEIKAIELVKAWENPMYYNLRNGGKGGMRSSQHTEETKEKLRIANSGENHPMYSKSLSEETKKILSKSKKGHEVSEETREKLRRANIGKRYPDEVNKKKGKKGKNNPFYGKSHSDEFKQYLSRTRIGENNPRAKTIICLNNSMIFGTITEASKWGNTSRNNVANCCNGKRLSIGKHPITGEPLRWMYLEDYENKYGKIDKEIS